LKTRSSISRSFHDLPRKILSEKIRTFFFFVLFFLIVWRFIEPCLIYHGGGIIRDFPVFFRGWTFFHPFLFHPGGIIEYASAFLSQFLYHSWTGALVLTGHAWLFCVCHDVFIQALGSPHLRRLRFVPPLLLLMLYSQYSFYFVTCTALLAALLFACLYIKINSTQNKPLNAIVFIVLSLILYMAAGGAYLVYAALCAIYEWVSKRGWRMGLLCVFSGACIPLILGVFIFGLGHGEAYGKLLPVFWEIQRYHTQGISIIYLLYLSLPVTVMGSALWRIRIRKRTPVADLAGNLKSETDSQKTPEGQPAGFFRNPAAHWIMESCVLLIVLGTAFALSFDKKVKTIMAVDFYACGRQWKKVVDCVKGTQNNNYIISSVDRALYHLHCFGNNIPLWQEPETLFLAGKSHDYSHWHKFDLYLDLGCVNLAEHHVAESLEFYGERPMLLQRMALIHMIKGNIGTAGIYLGALSKTLFFSKWAADYREKLMSDPELLGDEEIQRLRHLMPDKDYVIYDTAPDRFLLALLEKNKTNHMAFEYLMVWYLINKDLNKFGENAGRFHDFDYGKIPRLFEEAMLVLTRIPKKKFELKGFEISPNTIQRFDLFNQTLARYSGDVKSALNELKKDYSDSFFYYYIYSQSRVKS